MLVLVATKLHPVVLSVFRLGSVARLHLCFASQGLVRVATVVNEELHRYRRVGKDGSGPSDRC